MPIVFTFNEEARNKLRISDVRLKLAENYVANCKGVQGTWQERNDKLQALRKEYIKSYFEVSPDMINISLISFANTLFYEFNQSRCDVKILLDARREVWEEILQIYANGKISDETLVGLMRVIGIESDLYDESLFGGGLGKECVGNLSLFDAKIINRRFKHEHFYRNIQEVKNTFYDPGAFFAQMRDIFDKKAKNCFKSEGCKEYMADILKKASEFVCGEGIISEEIHKNISQIDSFEVTSSNNKRTYLDLTYQEEEERNTWVSQTIEEYEAYGAQYETTYETVTKDYNPKYVVKHLPKELSLEKDNKGYYLVHQACPITTDELIKMASRYGTKQELGRF